MKIESRIHDYEVVMLNNVFENKEEALSDLEYNRLFYFVDRNVYQIYSERITDFIGDDCCLVIEASERHKEFKMLHHYYEWLIKHGFRRNDLLVVIGGGVLQDIGGFVASTLYRGVNWLFIPTTLLAQADSCIGSKTSINYGTTKNVLGTFYPPHKIVIDSWFLDTLSEPYIQSGMGEIVKCHLMAHDSDFAHIRDGDLMMEQLITRSLIIKHSYFYADEFDHGLRNLLNYGHCFGHALESASEFKIPHGVAVVVGMRVANIISKNRRYLSQQAYDVMDEVLVRYCKGVDLSRVSNDAVVEYMRHDKKNVGALLSVVLTRGIGEQVKCDDVSEDEISVAFNALKTAEIA